MAKFLNRPVLFSVVALATLGGIAAWFVIQRGAVVPTLPTSPVSTSRQPGSETMAVESDLVGMTRLYSSQIERRDPTTDGWDTEKLGEQARKVLTSLGQLLERPDKLQPESVSTLITEDFRCGDLRPENLREVFNDGSFRVLRPGPEAAVEAKRVGASGMSEAFGALLEPLTESRDLRTFFKVHGVEKSAENNGASFFTRSFFESAATTTNGSVQQTAVWRCHWRKDASSPAGIRLAHIGIDDYEEVRFESSAGHLFRDCTEAVFAGEPTYAEQLLDSPTYWTRRLPSALGVGLTAHHGLAVGDANGDGLDDVYACRPGGMPNLLLIHKNDGTVVNEAAKAGLDWLDPTKSALFLDLDNDGDQDLVIGFTSSVRVFKNNGNLRFQPWSTIQPAFGLQSMTAVDFDNDAKLDLFLCFSPARSPVPYDDATNGKANRLYHNLGNGHFGDVSKERGIDPNQKQFSWAAAWEDYDNDGDVDLYVANDYGRNNLYRNDDGHFTDVAAQSGIEDIAAGMSVTWGDFNQDGWVDLYVSNMFSAAGNRVTYQRQFRQGTRGDRQELFQRHARGNSLFMNQGDGTFADTSVSAAVTMGRWSWGSTFADINNDGLEDLLVSNGYMTSENQDDL